MNIHVTKSINSVFNGLICKEPVDEYVLHKLINSDLLQIACHSVNCKQYENEKEQLMCYTKLVKDGYAHVLYTKTEIGRAKARNGLSYLNIRRQIRHTLADDSMVDIDIDNCHPVLMVQMLKNYGYNCQHLKSYVQNRKWWLNLVCKHWNIDKKHEGNVVLLKDIPKNLFLRLLYHGGYKKWEIDNDLEKRIDLPQELIEFMEEIKAIGQIFVELNPELLSVVEKQQIKSGKVDESGNSLNAVGSLCSCIMQEKENLVLEIIYKYLVFTKRIRDNVVSLCADGLMISKEYYTDSVLKELVGEIFIKSGFVVAMSRKEMDQGYSDLDSHVITDIPFKPNRHGVVDSLIERLDDLKRAYEKCEFYDSSLKYGKQTNNCISLSSDIKHICKLCNQTHKNGSCYIRINEVDNCYFGCHKKSKIIFKSRKGRDALKVVQVDKMNNSIDSFLQMETSGITVLKETSRFIGCNDDNEMVWKTDYNAKYLILNAHMGKGKTVFIKTYFNHMHFIHGDQRILFISQRKTFTNFICAEFGKYGIINYQDIKDGNYNKDRLCIQIESLHKVKNLQYDIIVIDEVETVLAQYSSSTMVYVRDCWNALTTAIRLCKHCITADAFILQRSIDFIRGISNIKNDKIVMIHNTKPFLEHRKAIQISQDEYDGKIIEDLKAGKRVIGISGSRDDLINLNNQLKTQCPEKSVLCYDRDSDRSDLADVNKVWSSCDFVGYTPVIQTGVSYMAIPFDVGYANLKSSNLARDSMQMMMRCRHLNENTVYFSINKRQIYNTSNINMFETYDIFQGDRLEKVDIMVNELKHDLVKNRSLIEMLKTSLVTSDPLLLKMMWYNVREYVLSHCHYNALCLRMLEMQGYDVMLLSSNDHNKDRVKNVILSDIEEYNKIDDIDPKELDEFRHQKNLSKEDGLRRDRYYFENMIVKELPIEQKTRLFYEYYQVSHKKKYLKNIKYERSALTHEELIDDDFEKNDQLINKMSMINSQLRHVRKFNELLGLDNSCVDGFVITKDIMTGVVLEYIRNNLSNLCTVFGSKVRPMTGDITSDNFSALKLLQKVYSSWSGLKINKFKCINGGKARSYITSNFDYFHSIQKLITEQDMINYMIYGCDEEE